MTNYRTPSSRGANQIDANPQKLGTPKDERWATGRNVKRALPNHRFDAVEVWALKTRDEDGNVVTVESGVSRERAQRWVAGASSKTMRTEREDGSFLASTNVAESADFGCNFCKVRQPEGLREIEYSRNGYQSYKLTICRSCRKDLQGHLAF